MNYVVLGLMFGDEGKGSIVDFLAREAKAGLVCRFNGGAQARHHVMHNGKVHGFAQFGSGTFAGVPTLLSKFMVVNPITMQVEAKLLNDLGMDEKVLWAGMLVDEFCRVTTPYHRALNRLREICRGSGRHGSCGMGVGETVADSILFPKETIYAGDIRYNKNIKTLLGSVRTRCLNTVKKIDGIEAATKTTAGQREMSTFDVDPAMILEPWARWSKQAQILKEDVAPNLIASSTVIFEGAQGVLLDERYGFHPYTSWSNCTQRNVLTLLAEAKVPFLPMTFGVMRPYLTRHGPGPFPTFNPLLTQSLTDRHNAFNEYQREFRVGWFDLPLMNYAIDCCKGGIDAIALTNMDRLKELGDHGMFCRYYNDGFKLKVPASMKEQAEQAKALQDVRPYYESMEDLGCGVMVTNKTPVRIVSYGPSADEKIMSTSPLNDFVNRISEVKSFAA